VPTAKAEQVPAPLMLHIWQVPQLAVVQQTPSVQWLLPHWLSAEQAPPFPIFGTQLPALLQ
jgi:hypothetical protein